LHRAWSRRPLAAPRPMFLVEARRVYGTFYGMSAVHRRPQTSRPSVLKSQPAVWLQAARSSDAPLPVRHHVRMKAKRPTAPCAPPRSGR
jgi:hypothetical protein